MVFGKSGHGPHLSSGGAGAVFRALAERPVNGAPVFPGKQNQPAACIPSPLLRILTMFSKKTTGGIENESNWDRAAHRRMRYNRAKSEIAMNDWYFC